MQDLNNLITAGAGWTLRSAYAINTSGQIVGGGNNAAGQFHAFLLTPVPEPALLAVPALAGTALARRRGVQRFIAQ